MAINLPDLTVVQPVDHATITQEIATQAAIENNNASDPAYRIALAVAYRETLIRQDANEQAKGLMLAYAKGTDLDHIAATYYRLPNGGYPARLAGEKDDDYRERVQLANEGLSVAGPYDAYQFHTRSFSQDIKHVEVVSPAPVEIVITVLSRQGDGSIDAQMSQAIYEHLMAYRPLGDEVTVQSAQIIPYTITATLAFSSAIDTTLVRNAALASLQQYVDARHRLGMNVVVSGVHAALTVEGVDAVTLHNFNDIVCESHQAAYCTGITLT